LFDLKVGKLNKQKVSVDRKQYFEIFERTFDAVVKFTDKKNPEECFEYLAGSYAEALQQLIDQGFIEPEKVTAEVEVKKVSTGKSKETFRLDERNHITYESYDLGQGVEYEIGWFRDSKLLKKTDVKSAGDALDIVEAWMQDFYNEVE